MDQRRPPAGAGDGAAAPLDVALICTANRARSPLAEAALGNLARPSLMVVRSRGIADLGEAAALEDTVAAAGWLHLDLTGHRSRTLAPGELAGADLVLGFEHLHLQSAVAHGGAPRERTFLLAHLVALLERVPPPLVTPPLDRARARLRSAAALADEMTPGRADEIGDPVGLPARYHRRAAQEVYALCERLVASLFG